MVLDGIGWYWMVSDGIGWYWMVSGISYSPPCDYRGCLAGFFRLNNIPFWMISAYQNVNKCWKTSTQFQKHWTTLEKPASQPTSNVFRSWAVPNGRQDSGFVALPVCCSKRNPTATTRISSQHWVGRSRPKYARCLGRRMPLPLCKRENAIAESLSRNRNSMNQSSWGLEVFGKVEWGLLIAKSIRDIMPIMLAVLHLSKSLDNDIPYHLFTRIGAFLQQISRIV